MSRISGVKVTPHHGRIEDKDLSFYQQFHVIILGLDSLEARRYMNNVACSLLGAFLACLPCQLILPCLCCFLDVLCSYCNANLGQTGDLGGTLCFQRPHWIIHPLSLLRTM